MMNRKIASDVIAISEITLRGGSMCDLRPLCEYYTIRQGVVYSSGHNIAFMHCT